MATGPIFISTSISMGLAKLVSISMRNVLGMFAVLEAAIEATRVADKNTKDAVIAEDGTYLVKSGDYLDKIIKQTAGNSSIRPSILRRAFVRANPSAFKRSNPNWMLANKRLKVPDVDDIKKVIFKDIDPNKAKARGIDPYEGWIQYP